MGGRLELAGRIIRGGANLAIGTGVVVGGLGAIDFFSGTDTPSENTSCDGAPPPDAGNFTDWFFNNCEGSGRTCTCADVRDWLCALDKKIHDEGVADMINDIRLLTPVSEDGMPPLHIQKLLIDYDRRVEGYDEKWGPPETFNCDDSWFEGSRGQKTIMEIHEELVRANEFNKLVAKTLDRIAPSNYVLPASVTNRPLPGGRDDGPDAGTIGLGLMLGGGIALAFLMMQPKKKNGI